MHQAKVALRNLHNRCRLKGISVQIALNIIGEPILEICDEEGGIRRITIDELIEMMYEESEIV